MRPCAEGSRLNRVWSDSDPHLDIEGCLITGAMQAKFVYKYAFIELRVKRWLA